MARRRKGGKLPWQKTNTQFRREAEAAAAARRAAMTPEEWEESQIPEVERQARAREAMRALQERGR